MRLPVLWRATRAYSLPASVVPVLLGTALAARGYAGAHTTHFNAGLFVLTLLGAVLAHVGANVLNDYYDFIKGVDTRPEHGSGVLTTGLLMAPQARLYAWALFAGAGICGLVLLRTNSLAVLTLCAIGLGCAILYSAALKQYGLGDLLIMIAFGVGLTLGAYVVQTGTASVQQWCFVALYSLPICLLVDAILHANNLRDAPDDRVARVRTLATMLPPAAGRVWQQVLLFGPLVFVILGVAMRLLPVWSLATLLTLPLLVRVERSGSVPGVAQTHLVFGLVYVGSLLLRPIFA